MAPTVSQAADALAGVGFNLTPAERALAEQRVADGTQDGLAAVETILDERCGPSGRGQIDYPNVAELLGVEQHLTFTAPEPEAEPEVEAVVQDEVPEEPEPEPAPEVEPEVEVEPETEASAEVTSEIGVQL